MIKLTGRGDHNWEEKFETAERAYWYLYGILSRKERFGNSQHEDFAFDCEDDLIIWEENGKKKYCAGWHWSECMYDDQIIMPDGKNLYELMWEIEDE